MKIVRLITLNHSEASKIRKRQLAGTMTEIYDDEQYLCFDQDELDNYKPKKIGRPPKKKQ